jgi:hypothetical protein
VAVDSVTGRHVLQHLIAAKNVTLPIVLPDRKHSLANGTASAGAEAECPAASPGISSKELS